MSRFYVVVVVVFYGRFIIILQWSHLLYFFCAPSRVAPNFVVLAQCQ